MTGFKYNLSWQYNEITCLLSQKTKKGFNKNIVFNVYSKASQIVHFDIFFIIFENIQYIFSYIPQPKGILANQNLNRKFLLPLKLPSGSKGGGGLSIFYKLFRKTILRFLEMTVDHD